MRIARLFVVLGGVAIVAGCGSEVEGQGNGTSTTYYRDVKPIIDGKCLDCHSLGGIAPFSLETYQDVAEVAPLVREMTGLGVMPPWPPAGDCNEYHGDRSLTPAQIDTIARWVDEGAPEGDPSEEATPVYQERPVLSRVDLGLTLPSPYTPTLYPDEYRCFLIPWPAQYTEPRFVTGFTTRPGNAGVVHHVIAFLAQPSMVPAYQQLDDADPGPGYTCFGDSGGPSQAWIGAWAPGTNGSDYPAGTGVRVEPGSMIVLQVHYNLLSDPVDASDQTSIELSLAASVQREAVIMPWANLAWVENGQMPIPAGDPDVMHSFDLAPGPFLSFITDGLLPDGDFMIYGAGLHMHELGASAQLTLDRDGGSQECLLRIDDWDFNWQGTYGLRQPMRASVLDRLRLECHFDNSVENQPFDRPTPVDVNWGNGTGDEMCLGMVYITAAP